MSFVSETGRHWRDDDLLRKLYGLEPEGEIRAEHLDACPDCGSRWAELWQARAELVRTLEAEPVCDERLAGQRRAFWSRVDHPRRYRIAKWAPALASCVMLLAAALLLSPLRTAPGTVAKKAIAAQPGQAAVSDAELFGDLAAISTPSAPRAAEPIYALFEGAGTEEERSF
jgi:hypothetical protein